MSSNSDFIAEDVQELKVHFFPQLYLQRRIWILDILREEQVTGVLDVGCGAGELLSVLCRPALWLSPPPSSGSSTSNDSIPNLHPTHLRGLDISSSDLDFAIQTTSPGEEEQGNNYYIPLRWEDLEVKIWKGGLEYINEEFVDVECIISTEVVEHLPPDIFPAFAPMLLGVYHPRLLLITTPSYTFNARFTAPSAPPSARNGYRDPTGRTDRMFRHSDHKFEWTVEEFQSWCKDVALQWGYEVRTSSIGRATEVDEWGRDDELGGATQVAAFKRLEMEGRERKARQLLQKFHSPKVQHELLATHQYSAHPKAKQPKSLVEIGIAIKKKLEYFREVFVQVEEIWMEKDIAILCGGWVEILIKAVEESEFLALRKDGNATERKTWIVELLDKIINPKILWPAEIKSSEDEEYIPTDWNPDEESKWT